MRQSYGNLVAKNFPGICSRLTTPAGSGGSSCQITIPMKTRFVFFMLVLSTGCTKEAVLPAPGSTDLTVMNQPGWKTESLNPDYTIQFSDRYEGNGMVGFEGPTFSKNRVDKQITFSYFFCGSTICSPYGQPITIPFTGLYPSTVVYAGTTLDKFVAFKRDGQLQAVFYFSEKAQTQGVLYLKEIKGGLLRESLNVSYPYNQRAEVLGILQTIQPK